MFGRKSTQKMRKVETRTSSITDTEAESHTVMSLFDLNPLLWNWNDSGIS